MHRKPWDELSDLEKREAMVRILGWNMEVLESAYSDWPTNDWFAFKDVWPKLSGMSTTEETIDNSPETLHLLLGQNYDGKPCVLRMVSYWDGGFPDPRPNDKEDYHRSESFVGSTWADAICKAAYMLIPVEIGATK